MNAQCPSCEELCSVLLKAFYGACFGLAFWGVIKVGPDLLWGVLGFVVLTYIALAWLFTFMLSDAFMIPIGTCFLAGLMVFWLYLGMERVKQWRAARVPVVVSVPRRHPDDETW